MPSNPVDEAHEDYINRRVAFAEENWRTYLNENPILISGARAHEISYSFGVLVGQDFAIEQERSRYEGLREDIDRLIQEHGADNNRSRSAFWLGVRGGYARYQKAPLKDTAYNDGWAIGERASARAAAAALTPSAPAEKEG